MGCLSLHMPVSRIPIGRDLQSRLSQGIATCMRFLLVKVLLIRLCFPGRPGKQATVHTSSNLSRISNCDGMEYMLQVHVKSMCGSALSITINLKTELKYVACKRCMQ